MLQTLYICLVSCMFKPKHVSSNLNCSVWNTALQIGSQLGVKVNGNNLQNRDFQHLLWQPWQCNILCTKNIFFKYGATIKTFIFKRLSVHHISCPWIFVWGFTFIGEPEKLSVRLKIALRQAKTILPGLRSEEMEKEKNTREQVPV